MVFVLVDFKRNLHRFFNLLKFSNWMFRHDCFFHICGFGNDAKNSDDSDVLTELIMMVMVFMLVTVLMWCVRNDDNDDDAM